MAGLKSEINGDQQGSTNRKMYHTWIHLHISFIPMVYNIISCKPYSTQYVDLIERLDLQGKQIYVPLDLLCQLEIQWQEIAEITPTH